MTMFHGSDGPAPAPRPKAARVNPYAVALAVIAIVGIVGGIVVRSVAASTSADWYIGYADQVDYGHVSWMSVSGTVSDLLLEVGIVALVGCLVVGGVAWEARRRR